MSKLRVLIADDEGLSRQRIRRLVHSEDDAEIIGECSNGAEALAAIREQSPDVVCLDVQMPELDGFELLAALRDEPLPQVLFITAYDEHALRAFEVHDVDYVLKPVDADRFRTAFARARLARAQASAANRLTGGHGRRCRGGAGHGVQLRQPHSREARRADVLREGRRH